MGTLTFRDAQEIMRRWLRDNRPYATIGDNGREDADYWLLDVSAPMEECRDGDQPMVVNKTTGAVEPMFFPSEFARADAMTPVTGVP